MSLTNSSQISDDGDINSENTLNQIPRDFYISNPVSVFLPKNISSQPFFSIEPFKLYQNFILNILPSLEIETTSLLTPAYQFLTTSFKKSDPFCLFHELMAHQYLIKIQSILHKLILTPSLSKLSILHHELYSFHLIIESTTITIELKDRKSVV